MSALNLTAFALSAYLCSVFLLLIDVITRSVGHQWITDNLNEGHLDMFYLLILSLFCTHTFLSRDVCTLSHDDPRVFLVCLRGEAIRVQKGGDNLRK